MKKKKEKKKRKKKGLLLVRLLHDHRTALDIHLLAIRPNAIASQWQKREHGVRSPLLWSLAEAQLVPQNRHVNQDVALSLVLGQKPLDRVRWICVPRQRWFSARARHSSRKDTPLAFSPPTTTTTTTDTIPARRH